MIAVVTDAEIFAVAAVLAGGATHAATGFGLALVAAPLVVAALPPEEAITILLLLGILTSVLTLATESRTPEPLWRDGAELLAWGTVGAAAGAFVLAGLSRDALQVLVTASVLGALATRLRRRALARAPDTAGSRTLTARAGFGFVAGVLTTTTTTNGPPLIVYLMRRRVPPVAFRDTLSVLFVGFGTIGIAAIAIGDGELALAGGTTTAAMVGAAAAGHLAGRPLFARLARGHYDAAVAILLAASVVVGGVVALA